MMMENRDTGVSKKSAQLSQTRVAFAVCGGVGAVEVVKIIRELRRHSAGIQPFMTPSSSRFVGADAIAWASHGEVITVASSKVEYLQTFDVLVVAPLTLNTLAKAALGLSDNVVSLLIASHLGAKRPALFVPAMNVLMKQHPLYQEYVARLSSWGVRFLENNEDEDRIKMPSAESVLAGVLGLL